MKSVDPHPTMVVKVHLLTLLVRLGVGGNFRIYPNGLWQDGVPNPYNHIIGPPIISVKWADA